MTAKVKYLVTALARAYLVQSRVPLCPAALNQAQVDRLNAVFRDAADAIEAVRDAIAIEIAMHGVCPWCNELSHPAGQSCEPTGATT